MYKDLISYQLADGITEAHLLEVAQEIIDNWMKKLPGFISWEITKHENGYTDIVTWESAAAAKNAEKEMANIPNSMAWYACYKMESISSQHLTTVGSF